ncbi:MAG: DMT family transporter [Acidimicrobiia bacterium]
MSRSHVPPLIAAAACWGFGAAVSKQAVSHLPPTALLVVQLASSLALMTVVGARSFRRDRPSLRVALLGVVNPELAYLLSLAGLATITAGLSVLLWAVEPVFILGLAWALSARRPSTRVLIASAVAVVGAAVAATGEVSGGALGGVVLTVAAVGCCAVYAVAAGEWPETSSASAVVAAQQGVALLFGLSVLGVAAVAGLDVSVSDVPVVGWLSAVLSGVLYYGLAFWAFITGLRRTSPSVAGIYVALVPVFGVAAGWVLVGERLTFSRVLGGALVVAAVAAVSRSGTATELRPVAFGR